MATTQQPTTADERKKVWYWSPVQPQLSESTISLFESYSHIPRGELMKHIEDIREKAWAIYNYPCIGLYRFLDFSIQQHPLYNDILERVKQGDKLLDLGCCFGQDIRRLVADGADGANILGADLEQGFLDLGYELFRDKETLPTKFIAGDIFDESFLKDYEGKFNIIHVGSFIHLFDYDQQVFIVKRLAKLLVDKPGSIVIGRQVGTHNPGNTPLAGSDSKKQMYRHNEETFKEMWNKNAGGDWKVHVKMTEWEMVGGEVNQHGKEIKETARIMITFSMEKMKL